MNPGRLQRLEKRTLQLLLWGNRLMFGSLLLGGVGLMLSMGLFQLLKEPGKALPFNAMSFNRAEFVALHPELSRDRSFRYQSRWDGTLNGVGIGLSVGRNIPLIGFWLGPLLGGAIGYQLEARQTTAYSE